MKIPATVKWRVWSLVVGGSEAARRVGVTVGSNCRVYSGRFGSEPWLVSIGSNTVVSFGVTFVTHDASGALFTDSRGRRFLFRRVSIGSDCFIGANSLILPGVTIKDRVIVGAGSVVTRSIPAGVVIAGNPAKFVCTFDDLKQRALRTWKSEADGVGQRFVDRVNSLVDDDERGWLVVPEDSRKS